MNKQKKRVHSRKKKRGLIQVLTPYDFAKYRKNKFYYSPAQMHNHGKDGMYIEIDHVLQPTSNISIKIKKTKPNDDQVHEAYKVQRGRVKWCKELEDNKGKRFGVGIQIFETVVQTEILNSHC